MAFAYTRKKCTRNAKPEKANKTLFSLHLINIPAFLWQVFFTWRGKNYPIPRAKAKE
jgi:hypothetical protein